MSGALIPVAPTQGIPLDCLTLEARRTLVSGPRGTVIMSVTQKESSMPVRHPNFSDFCQGTPLYCLALEASGAYSHESYRAITNRENVLK